MRQQSITVRRRRPRVGHLCAGLCVSLGRLQLLQAGWRNLRCCTGSVDEDAAGCRRRLALFIGLLRYACREEMCLAM
jgi:hypothetical protein